MVDVGMFLCSGLINKNNLGRCQNMVSKKRVLIVGCGIGGATAAHALSRNGHNVHCIESRPERPKTGAGICLLSNAMRALDTLGLAEPCLDSGLAFDVFRQFDAAGTLLSTSPGSRSCGIRRPELARILETAAHESGSFIERGITVKTLTESGDGVAVTFSDGRSAKYDLVVGADGAYSQLRSELFGAECSPRFAGQIAWRFNAPRPAEVDGFCLYRLPSGQAVGAFPTSNETCYLFYLEPAKEIVRIPDDQTDVLIRERLADFTAPFIRESLEQVTDPSQVIVRPLEITLVPPPWHRGRTVLIGDAAHAPTPQMTSGGGMAIEDAAVLSEIMNEVESVDDVLDEFSKRRFNRVETIFNASEQLSLHEQFDPIGKAKETADLLLETYHFLEKPY